MEILGWVVATETDQQGILLPLAAPLPVYPLGEGRQPMADGVLVPDVRSETLDIEPVLSDIGLCLRLKLFPPKDPLGVGPGDVVYPDQLKFEVL